MMQFLNEMRNKQFKI